MWTMEKKGKREELARKKHESTVVYSNHQSTRFHIFKYGDVIAP